MLSSQIKFNSIREYRKGRKIVACKMAMGMSPGENFSYSSISLRVYHEISGKALIRGLINPLTGKINLLFFQQIDYQSLFFIRIFGFMRSIYGNLDREG